MRTERAELVAVLGLCIVSSLINATLFWVTGMWANDTHAAYSFFLSQIESLHRFGVPAYWFPQSQGGYPGYFYSLLGIMNCGKPAFVLLGAAAWLAGRAGVPLPAMPTLYVAYFAVLVPSLFVAAVWLLARQIFRSRLVLAYVMVVAAFSPGVLLNLSDIGVIEHTAYALLAAAAFLAFVRRPTSFRALRLLFCVLLLLVAPAHMLLVTAAPLLPLFLVAACVPRFYRRRVLRSLRTIPPWGWGLAALLIGVCAWPSVVVYRGAPELRHRGEGGLTYSFHDIKPGNPLEVLLASTPGVGFTWDWYGMPSSGPPSQFLPRSLTTTAELGEGAYGYIGFLGLPLAAMGFVSGRYTLRLKLLVAAVLAFGVIGLGGHSPFCAALLGAIPPLRSMNHFGDLLYRAGGFLIPVFAAGLGLEALMRRPRERARPLAALVVVSATLSLLYVAYVLNGTAGTLAGWAAGLAVTVALVLLSLSRETIPTRRAFAGALLVALTFVDVSTVAFWFIRQNCLQPRGGDDLDGTFLALSRARKGGNSVANSLLVQPEAVDRARRGIVWQDLPLLAVYDVSRPVPDDAPVWRAEWASGGAAVLTAMTYNTWQIAVDSPRPARLFLRDTYSPDWRARVDGRPVPVLRAPHGFKAVDVPSGHSRVDFAFAPPGVAVSLGAAYLVLGGLGLVVARAAGRRAHAESN